MEFFSFLWKILLSVFFFFFLSHTVSPVYSQNSVLNCSFIHHHTNADYYHSVNHCSFDKKQNILGFCLLRETWHLVPKPSHPSLTRMNPAEWNAERPWASHFLLHCTLQIYPTPPPGRGQRMGEPIIFPNVPSLFLSISHLDWIQIPSLPVSLLAKAPSVHSKLTFFFFASLSNFNSKLFIDILFVSHGLEWVLHL